MDEKDIKLFDGWEVFDHQTKSIDGKQFFRIRYIHRQSKSGIVFLSQPSEKIGETTFVIEEYGFGAINPDDFTELLGSTSIDRHETEDIGEAVGHVMDIMRDCSLFSFNFEDR